jgi:hypothetical protein
MSRPAPVLLGLGLGLALAAAGLGWNAWKGLEGPAELHVGETVDRLVSGAPLPFRMRLEAMAVDGPLGAPKVLISESGREHALEPKMGESWASGQTTIAVQQVLPNAMPDFRFRETEKGPDQPVLHLMLGLGTPVPLEGYLVARDSVRRRFDEPAGRFSALLVERWDDALLKELTPRPGKLILSLAGREWEHPATPGTWVFPSFDLRIQDVIPDLGMEEGKDGRPRVFHRTQTPRNPWVLLTLEQHGGGSADLLVAAQPPDNPAYRATLAAALPPGADLRYDRRNEELQRRFVVFTPQGEVRLVEDGHVVRQETLASQQPFVVSKGLSVTVLDRYLRAEAQENYRPAPEGSGLTSAVQIQVAGAERGSYWLGLERPETVLSKKFQARFGAPTPSLEAVRARLIVSAPNGDLLVQRTLTGADALEVDGHELRLARGASQEGRWVRVQVRRDPGRIPLILGLALLGLAAALLVHARLRREMPR